MMTESKFVSNLSTNVPAQTSGATRSIAATQTPDAKEVLATIMLRTIISAPRVKESISAFLSPCEHLNLEHLQACLIHLSDDQVWNKGDFTEFMRDLHGGKTRTIVIDGGISCLNSEGKPAGGDVGNSIIFLLALKHRYKNANVVIKANKESMYVFNKFFNNQPGWMDFKKGKVPSLTISLAPIYDQEITMVKEADVHDFLDQTSSNKKYISVAFQPPQGSHANIQISDNPRDDLQFGMHTKRGGDEQWGLHPTELFPVYEQYSPTSEYLISILQSVDKTFNPPSEDFELCFGYFNHNINGTRFSDQIHELANSNHEKNYVLLIKKLPPQYRLEKVNNLTVIEYDFLPFKDFSAMVSGSDHTLVTGFASLTQGLNKAKEGHLYVELVDWIGDQIIPKEILPMVSTLHAGQFKAATNPGKYAPQQSLMSSSQFGLTPILQHGRDNAFNKSQDYRRIYYLQAQIMGYNSLDAQHYSTTDKTTRSEIDAYQINKIEYVRALERCDPESISRTLNKQIGHYQKLNPNTYITTGKFKGYSPLHIVIKHHHIGNARDAALALLQREADPNKFR